jgi:hypothetical protein
MVAVDVMDVPLGRNLSAGVQPNLPMQACATVPQHAPARAVIEPPRIAAIHDTAIFNHFDHIIFSMSISWQAMDSSGIRPFPFT